MIKNYLKTTFRSFAKNKTFVIINTLGMGIALACCIIAYLNQKFNDDFDVQHVKAENIYRVAFKRVINDYTHSVGLTPAPLAPNIRENFSNVGRAVRLYPSGGDFKVGDELFNAGVAAVEDGYFDMFTVPLVSGSYEALNDQRSILISDETADKYFEDGNALGETIIYYNNDKEVEFVVGGVFQKFPLNSSFGYDAFVNYDNLKAIFEWEHDTDWASFSNTFVWLENPSAIPDIERQLNENYIEIQNQVKKDYAVNRYYLEPFEGMAQRAEREDIWSHWFQSALPVPAVIAPSVMAVLILLIACFNFTNTSIAIANRRIKEIGIRKVMGSSKKQMAFQFLSENVLLALIALIIALILCYFLVPAYSAMWEFLELEFDFAGNWGFYLFLIALLVLTGLVSGAYPAIYVSGLQPTSILKGTFKVGGTSRMTKSLLTIQYAISIIAIICGIVFTQNAKYQQDYDVGYDREGIVYTYIENEANFNMFRNTIDGNPDIESIAGSQHNIAWSWWSDPINYEGTDMDTDIMEVGYNYLDVVGATIKEGRNFTRDSETDVEQSIIINQTFANRLGWEGDVIGKRVVLRDSIQLFVVGVVKDLYLRALWEPIEPLMIRLSKPENYSFLTVSAKPGQEKAVKEFMDAKWKETFPDKLSSVRYLMEQDLAESNLVNENIKKMFIFLGLVAVLLSATGLFSMVTLNLIKRMKEIGVRKVLGAKIGNIAYVVNRQFMWILVIASILGSVGGYFLSDMLMGSIWAYYTEVTPVAIIGAFLLIVLVSSITVGQRVYSAATANPAQTLKDE